MRLIDPSGVLITVSEKKGGRLLSQGYKREGAVSEAAPSPAPAKPVKAPESDAKPRPRPRKATTPDND